MCTHTVHSWLNILTRPRQEEDLRGSTGKIRLECTIGSFSSPNHTPQLKKQLTHLPSTFVLAARHTARQRHPPSLRTTKQCNATPSIDFCVAPCHRRPWGPTPNSPFCIVFNNWIKAWNKASTPLVHLKSPSFS